MNIKKIITFSIIFVLILSCVYLLFEVKKNTSNQLNEKNLKIKKLIKRISEIESEKNLSNKTIFPETQFAKFDFKEITLSSDFALSILTPR